MTTTDQFRRHRLEEMMDLYNHLVALADLTGSQKVYDNAWQLRRMIKAEVRELANR
ncbi:MAG: hypothetical protein ACR2OV_07380 [Hyphomicrobiaceae bacterium]